MSSLKEQTEEIAKQFKAAGDASMAHANRILDNRPSLLLRGALPSVAVPPSKLRYWFVETLLNQAADIADRCVAVQREIDELAIREAEAYGDMVADAVNLSNAELQLAQANFSLRELEYRDTTLNLTPSESYGEESERDVSGWKRDKIHHYWISAAYTAIKDLSDKAAAQQSQMKWSSVLARMDHRAELATIERGREFHAAEVRVRQAQSDGLDALAKAKRKYREQLDGPYNFAAKKALLSKNQLVGDIVEVLQRCEVASRGLREIFGMQPTDIAAQLPSLQDLKDHPDQIPQHFAYVVWAWVNEAIRWLLRFSHDEQAMTLVVEVPASVKTFSLVMPAGPFSHIRVRGISCSAVTRTPSPDCVFAAEINAPPRAQFFYSMGRVQEYDQTRPPCVIGRVACVESIRPPEVGGTDVLLNASPFAPASQPQWTIEVKAITEAAKRADLVSTLIEVHVVARASKD